MPRGARFDPPATSPVTPVDILFPTEVWPLIVTLKTTEEFERDFPGRGDNVLTGWGFQLGKLYRARLDDGSKDVPTGGSYLVLSDSAVQQVFYQERFHVIAKLGRDGA